MAGGGGEKHSCRVNNRQTAPEAAEWKGSLLKVLVGSREETPGGQRDDCPSNGDFMGWTVPVVRTNIGLGAHEFTHVHLVSVSGGTWVEVSGPHTTICSLQSPGDTSD